MNKNDIRGRCENCENAQITSCGNWSFVSCTHKPYKGKWTREIKDCPKLPEKILINK